MLWGAAEPPRPPGGGLEGGDGSPCARLDAVAVGTPLPAVDDVAAEVGFVFRSAMNLVRQASLKKQQEKVKALSYLTLFITKQTTVAFILLFCTAANCIVIRV